MVFECKNSQGNKYLRRNWHVWMKLREKHDKYYEHISRKRLGLMDLPLENFEQLNYFSAEVAKIFFEKYPHWRKFAVFDTNVRSMLVEVVSPKNIDLKLRIYTDEDEITVELDYWHQHFGFAEQSIQEICEEAFLLIDQIIQEEAVVEIWMNGSEWKGSSLVLAKEFENYFQPIEATRVYWKSWLETYNLESNIKQLQRNQI
jgi:hypothetical protein